MKVEHQLPGLLNRCLRTGPLGLDGHFPAERRKNDRCEQTVQDWLVVRGAASDDGADS